MAEIQFWKDKVNKTVEPTLYSVKAEELSKSIAKECEDSRGQKNKRTQIRKFYDEVVRLEMAARNKSTNWDNILPLVHMLAAKAAYAKGRNLVTDRFVNFIQSSIKQVERPEDLKIFAGFFEAFIGFYRMHCKSN